MYADAMYEDTVERLRDLKPRQLEAVHAIIIEISQMNEESNDDNKESFVSPLGINTEDQLWEHIDHSLSQAKSGIGRDVDEVIDEFSALLY